MSNKVVVCDTETSDLIQPCRDSDERQPHLVQIAALLVDQESKKTISSLNVIIRPDGWKISDEAMGIHGITQEMAMDLGVSERLAIQLFTDFIKDGDNNFRTLVGHNIAFDARIFRIAMKRYDYRDEAEDQKESCETFCTMHNSTKILQIPNVGKKGLKVPKLAEAYEYFTGKKIEGAHDAMVDTKACRDVFFGIKDYEG